MGGDGDDQGAKFESSIFDMHVHVVQMQGHSHVGLCCLAGLQDVYQHSLQHCCLCLIGRVVL